MLATAYNPGVPLDRKPLRCLPRHLRRQAVRSTGLLGSSIISLPPNLPSSNAKTSLCPMMPVRPPSACRAWGVNTPPGGSQAYQIYFTIHVQDSIASCFAERQERLWYC